MVDKGCGFWYNNIRKLKEVDTMKQYKIRGSIVIIKAKCMKDAIRKLVEESDFVYQNHWYTRSNRKAWAEVWTGYGYYCIVEEV